MVLASYGLIQRAGLDPFTWSYVPRGRVFSLCGHPNLLAGTLAFSIPITLGVLLSSTRILNRVLLLLGLTIQGACLIFTFSRGGYIASGISLLVMVIVVRKHANSKEILMAISSLLIGIVAAYKIGSNYDPFSPDPAIAASVSLDQYIGA